LTSLLLVEGTVKCTGLFVTLQQIELSRSTIAGYHIIYCAHFSLITDIQNLAHSKKETLNYYLIIQVLGGGEAKHTSHILFTVVALHDDKPFK
jgi:hypothetical protein